MKHSSNKTEGSADKHLDNSSNNKPKNEKFDFGHLLVEARKAKNYTVEEVYQYLKIARHIIIALETNDKEALPAPTYTRGYIRAYTKFLEMPEDKVLAIYNRAVPHNAVSDLKPRSNLPGETNSQSPLIKTITILLIVAGIATLVFGSVQYYQKKADVLGAQIEENQLDEEQLDLSNDPQSFSTTRALNIKQSARITDDDSLIVDKSDFIELDTENAAAENIEVEVAGKEIVKTEASAVKTVETKESSDNAVETTPAVVVVKTNIEVVTNETTNEVANNIEFEAGSDRLEIFTEKGSWVEVRDANESRLFYNMLSEGRAKVLVGRAPFSISLGNAQTTRVTINDLEVDIKKYIRSSNTASFEISTQGKSVIFH